ncbi:type IV pilin protein [Christiangramia marina]|uniref:type IV pilin protein n=1 Tax=Christiangramia marina TaxID=409436 RepID=UPI003AA7B9B9
MKKIPAFNLQEMLIVLAILGILLLIALPNFMPLISKTKAQEAKIQLKYIANLQKQYQYLNSKYTMDFNQLDFEKPLTVISGGSSNYKYEVVEANTNNFVVRATAVVDFDGDGILNVWEIDRNGNPIQKIPD